jgi:hypothetical protein
MSEVRQSKLQEVNPAKLKLSCGVHALSAMMARPREPSMSNLLFLRRSYAYRYAAAAALRKARSLPVGPERNVERVLARGLRDLAETEAWLEGQRCHHSQFLRVPVWERERRL